MAEGTTVDLELEISSASSHFGPNDEVIVRLFLWNLSDDPIKVNARFSPNATDLPGEVSFQVMAPDGAPVPFGARVNIGDPDQSDYTAVPPWNGVGRQFDLRTYFDLDRAGNYSITGSYTGGFSDLEAPAQLWTDPISSNTITIEIG